MHQDRHIAEERFRWLIENAPDVVSRYIAKPVPRFDYVSPSVTKILGYTPEEHYQDPALPYKCIYPDDRDKLASLEERFAASAEPLILRYVAKDGRIVWTEHHAVTLVTEDGQVVIEGIWRDVTRQQEDRIEKEKQLVRLYALQAIDHAILGSMDLEPCLAIFADKALETLGVSAINVILAEPITSKLEHAVSRGFKTKVQLTPIDRGHGYAGRVFLERKIVKIDSLRSADPPFMRTEVIDEEGFESYCGVPLIARGNCHGILEIFHSSKLPEEDSWMSYVLNLSSHLALLIESIRTLESLHRTNDQLAHAYDATIEGWARALDLRDQETEGHSRRVTEKTVQLASRMGISDSEIPNIRRGCLLHDVGKLSVSDTILLKQGPLTEEERLLMQKHPQSAFRLLSPIMFLGPALSIPYSHHEKWDGTGYPQGLKGEEIPLPARIFAVIDVWDALSSDRPYRKGWPKLEVFRYLIEHKGTHFDPSVVDAFVEMELSETEKSEVMFKPSIG